MTAKERNSKIVKVLEDNGIDWQSVHLWVESCGNVILTEVEYADLQKSSVDNS